MILRSFFVFLILIGIVAIWYYYSPDKRSVTIEATTENLLLKLNSVTRWRVEKAIVCKPFSAKRTKNINESPDPGTSDAVCRSPISSAEDPLLVSWPIGTTLQLSRHGLGPIEILVQTEREENQGSDDQHNEIVASSAGKEISIVHNTRIFIMPDNLSSLTSLDYIGEARVGTVVGSGTRTLLLSGQYEIREIFRFRTASEIVRSDNLMMGDELSITDDNGPLKTTSGFIAVKDPDNRGFDLLLTGTSDSSTALLVERRGYDRTFIVPRWTERALADSVGLAITALLGFLLTVLTIVSEIINLKSAAHPK